MINQGEECDTNTETLPEVPQVCSVMFRIRLCSVNPSQLPEVGHTSQGNSVTCHALCTMSCRINVEKKVHTAGVSALNGITLSVVPTFGIC